MVYVDAIAVTNVPALWSNQAEADARIIMHAVEADRKGAETIVVSSLDTDVLVLLLHHRTQIRAYRIFFLTGRTGKHASLTRYEPCHEKTCLCLMRTTKAQICLRIRAV